MSSLAEHFYQYFSLSFANSEELKQENFKIRYQVYCSELNYEPIDKFPDRMEIDEYDDRSLHFLLKHKPSDCYAGCVRIVLPDWKLHQNNLPFEQAITEKLNFYSNDCERFKYCEISRLAVLSQFRRRIGEDTNPIGELLSRQHINGNINSSKKDRQRKFPLIAFSLYWTSISIALAMGIDIIALMEPRLARHLRSVGIFSTSISDLFEYHGKRGIFLIKPSELIDRMDEDIKALFEVIQAQVNSSISPREWDELQQKIKQQKIISSVA
jgi:N-acyl amino acid synthase of PEP-CTERM/exosortase system